MRSRGVQKAKGRGGARWFVALAVLLVLVPEVQAQDAVLEALRDQRQRVRSVEVLQEIGPKSAAYGPAEVAARSEREGYRRVSPMLPSMRPPAVPLPPLRIRPEPPPPAAPVGPRVLEDLQWSRVAPGDEAAFLARFGDALWTSADRFARTPIDTMQTLEVRARLHATFGAPTRTPIARGRPEMGSGSEFIQFEYWFAVNDTIPFVVMDRAGPFGRGVVMVADEEHADVLRTVREDLARRLLMTSHLMPYVDYYQSREGGQWYRTGYDGTRYYILETERPRWARRSRSREAWYEFR